MTSPGFDWSEYDADKSMQMAMDQASKVLLTFRGDMPTEKAAVHIAHVDMWVRIAQVHATNALADAYKAAAKLTWQDVIPE